VWCNRHIRQNLNEAFKAKSKQKEESTDGSETKNAAAWNNKGIALYDRGWHDEALIAFDEVIRRQVSSRLRVGFKYSFRVNYKYIYLAMIICFCHSLTEIQIAAKPHNATC
jgi:hypothetical protein